MLQMLSELANEVVGPGPDQKQTPGTQKVLEVEEFAEDNGDAVPPLQK